MRIITLESSSYFSNGYLVVCGNECFIIDPGQPASVFESAISENGLTPKMILLTHGHFDHITSADALRDRFGIPLSVHKDDAELLTDTQKNVYSLFFDGTFTARPAEKVFSDGDEIELSGETVKVIHTPGHTEGSSCFQCENALITGDTLFSAGVGRTDFIGGNERKLYDSLKKLRDIEGGGKITIYPGHGKTNILSAALDNFIY